MKMRPIHHAAPRRTPVEWGIRGGIAIGALFLGWAAVTHSLGYTLRGSRSELAYSLSSHDGRIGALLSEVLSSTEVDKATRARSDRIARQALVQDPTAVAAVATLGINAQLRGDIGAARRIFAYANQLSRRDLRTQLWAIEDAVSRNDIPGVLKNYDIALRTSRFAPALLYPVLNAAIADDKVTEGMVALLAKRPPWGKDFLNQAALGGDPVATAALLRKARRARVAVPLSADTMVIDALSHKQQYDLAWAHYAAITGANRQQSRDPHFTAARTSISLFDWKPVLDDAGVTATLRPGGFEYAVSPMAGGVVLQQAQVLPPGIYTLSGRATGIDPASGARGYWVVRCIGGAELARVPLPGSIAEGRFEGRVDIPATCPAQYLELTVQAGNQSSDVSGQVSEVQLLRRP